MGRGVLDPQAAHKGRQVRLEGRGLNDDSFHLFSPSGPILAGDMEKGKENTLAATGRGPLPVMLFAAGFQGYFEWAQRKPVKL